jgi:hypothetical protein
MNIQSQSWQDLQVANPLDPKTIIPYAILGGSTIGTFTRSTNALQSTWTASSLAFTGNNTQLISTDTTDASTEVDAAQWTFTHQMVNVAANIPPSMNKVVFMRAGKNWQNKIEIAFGASTYNNVQLTVRDNLGTSGQFLNSATGSVPVISFGNGITGNQVLSLPVLQPGVYNMVLVMETGASWSAFEMEWIVVP